jgi:RNA polymerase primary sigma factor
MVTATAASRIQRRCESAAATAQQSSRFTEPRVVEESLDQVPESRRLSAEQEAALFRRMIDSRRRAETLREMLIGERANPQIRSAIQRHARAVTEVRNYLIRVFSKLAASVASRYVTAECRLDELLSEAHITLLRAVELFDPDRGYRFSTYATNAIRHNLHRYLSNQYKSRMLASAAVEPESLADETVGCPERREREYRVRMDRIANWMSRLDRREQTILESRYGLSRDSRTATLQCLADQLGVSRERIRQLERRAIAKLRGMAEDERCEFDA